ncbi:MAG: ferritin-like domain-containing protein [Acidobacteriota bacterium]|nr:ferritin-like domain-containing protein [Acidobacteriota bacterium]
MDRTQGSGGLVQAVEAVPNSRRKFFTGSAKWAGMAAVASRLAAQSTPVPAGDIAILNYALTLEHLEANFYTQGLKTFTSVDFANGQFMQGLGDQINGDVFGFLSIIRDHEQTHERKLTSVIKSLGGTPVAACTYNFGYKTADDFIAIAMALENTGVMAYDGALGQIQTPSLRTAGATIATVEARHAAYLNQLNGAVPFPDAFDTPKTMAQILAIAGPFITSCPGM